MSIKAFHMLATTVRMSLIFHKGYSETLHRQTFSELILVAPLSNASYIIVATAYPAGPSNDPGFKVFIRAPASTKLLSWSVVVTTASEFRVPTSIPIFLCGFARTKHASLLFRVPRNNSPSGNSYPY